MGEQHLHFLALLGLQEEALVVSAGEPEVTAQAWLQRFPPSLYPAPTFHNDGCVWLPSLASPHLHLALTLYAHGHCFFRKGHSSSPEPSPNPAQPLLQAHDKKKLALLLEVLKN